MVKIQYTAKTTADELYAQLIRCCDSYEMLPALMDYWRDNTVFKADMFYEVLGRIWANCDNIAEYRDDLYMGIFDGGVQRDLADLMMNPEELGVFRALPEVLTVYRSCYAENKYGLSWTLDRSIAETFTTLNRYRRKGETPMLLTARVERDETIYKNGRDEQEIICADPQIIGEEMLPVSK